MTDKEIREHNAEHNKKRSEYLLKKLHSFNINLSDDEFGLIIMNLLTLTDEALKGMNENNLNDTLKKWYSKKENHIKAMAIILADGLGITKIKFTSRFIAETIVNYAKTCETYEG